MAIFFSLSVGLKVKLIFERQIEALMKNKAMKNKAKAQSKNKSWRVLKVVILIPSPLLVNMLR